MQSVFIPLINNNEFSSMHYRYLINAMIEYQRSLYVEGIELEEETITLCLKYIIMNREYHYLQMLMQYQSFPKTLEVANLLSSAFYNGCSEILQVTVDMFYYLKKPVEVIKVMVKAKKLTEVLQYIERHRLKGCKARELLQVAQELPVKERNLYVTYFSKVNVSIKIKE